MNGFEVALLRTLLLEVGLATLAYMALACERTRRLLAVILMTLALFVLAPAPSSAQTVYASGELRQLLPQMEYFRLEALMRFKLDGIRVAWIPIDGPGGTLGQVRATLERPESVFYLDIDDLPPALLMQGRMSLLYREVIIHELTHLQQQRRGLWYRYRMRSWQRLPYRDRPHEIEAFERGHRLAPVWSNLYSH